MLNEKNDSQTETLRKLVGSALCDFITYMGSVKDPFIVGGQYPNDKLVKVFHAWLLSRKFEIEGASDYVKNWISLYQQGTFAGLKDSVDKSPKPPELPKTPKPPKLPKTPKPPESPKLPKSPQKENVVPDDGYYTGDDWKPKEDQKDDWRKEGEDWKKDSENGESQSA